MVLFRLRSQQTGQVRDFSLLDILNALGDVTNDEIRFPDGNREDVYNLSSFHDLSAGEANNGGTTAPRPSDGATRLVNEAIPITNGQQSVNLGQAPVGICLVFLNGLKLRQGIDYNKAGRSLTFLSPLRSSVDHSDLLEALYDVPA